MAKTLYFNLEDDIKSIITRVRNEHSEQVVLVFPRRSYIFADAVNLKLLKKHLDALNKQASILTMDERGQAFAKEAGFELKVMHTNGNQRRHAGDISIPVRRAEPKTEEPPPVIEEPAEQEEEPPPPPKPKPAPIHVKKAHTNNIPQVAVRDTIFSEAPRRSNYSPFSGTHRKTHVDHKTRKLVLVGGVALVLLVSLLMYTVFLPKATVRVFAKAEPLVRDLEINMNTKSVEADVARLQLPAYSFERTVDVSTKFQTSGKKELGSTAQGKIRIFNLTTGPLNLRAATTTVTAANGKTYKLAADALGVKAVSSKNVSNPDAGFVAAVVAVSPGESSNLAVGTRVEVSNTVFGSRPDLLYAQVEEVITGGNSRFVSIIDEAELTAAQENLKASAVEQLANSFKSEGRYLAEKAYTPEVLEFKTDQPVGTETPTYTGSMKLKVTGLVFDPVMLSDLVRSRVQQVLPQAVSLQSVEKDQMTFRVNQLDIPGGVMRVVVHFESRSFRDVDESSFKNNLPGKDKEQVKKDLSKRPEVDKVEIQGWPDWFAKLPRLSSRITFEERRE